jgi:hypothetical protein
VNVGSGLGNQLFQLGFLHFCSVLLDAVPILEDSNKTNSPHSIINYFQSIFKDVLFLDSSQHVGQRAYTRRLFFQENVDGKVENWQERIGEMWKEGDDILFEFSGYFQQWVYMDGIRDTFISTLNFKEKTKLKEKYPSIHDKVFVHIRGGDYLDLIHHFVDLRSYYAKCQDLCKEKGDNEFIIFTNDEKYAKEFLKKNNLFLEAPFVDENEIDSLYLMSHCKACICANSTFSWWGAYLNKDRTIYFPSQWFSGHMVHTNIEGYFFPGCKRVSVE